MNTPALDGTPPLAVDIDGTLTDHRRIVDPRAMSVLQAWPAPVVIATGKSFPYPVGLCEFFGLDQTVIAENGGVVLAGRNGPLLIEGDPEKTRMAADALMDRGYDLGWGEADLVNRWRETEVAVNRDVPKDIVDEIATAAGLVVLDTGFAYHITSPNVSKGKGLAVLADELGLSARDFVAVGDSENDVAMFEEVDRAVAVGNADDLAKTAADHVTADDHANGFLEAVAWLNE